MNILNRLRRLRKTEAIRKMVRESHLAVEDLIAPLFVVEGEGIKKEIKSMPEQFHFSLDTLKDEVKELVDLKIPAVILFGIPKKKDPEGVCAFDAEGIVQKAIRMLKKHFPELLVVTDVCLCAYTSHGHCGILSKNDVENDATVKQLAKVALSYANAGADIIAPSDMMDGRVLAIRTLLDESGYADIPIISYAVKYASAYYGPFRDAAESAPAFGDRRSYQMDPANRREAMLEADLDVIEGADIIMVKPALAYLDIIRELRDRIDLPIAAYSVSGEYSMIKCAAVAGVIDGEKVMMESLLSMKRAGAEVIITYFAKEVAQLLGRS